MRIDLAWEVFKIGVLAIGLLAACRPQPTAGEVLVSGENRRTLDPGLERSDRIETLDLAVGDGDSLHVVWSAALQSVEGTLPKYHTFYAHDRQGGTSWSPPHVLNHEPSQSLRVLTVRDRVHVLSGLRIRHHLSEDRGRAWRDLGEVLAAPAGAVLRFDAAVVDGEPALAVLVHVPPALALDAEPRQDVFFFRPSNSGHRPLTLLASFPPSEFDPPNPKLVSDGETLHVLVGLNAENRASGSSRGNAVGQTARLFSLRSADRGGSWTEPLEIPLGGAGARAAGLQRIQEIEALTTAEGELVVLSANGIYGLRSISGRGFSPPQRINPYTTTWSRGSAESSALAVASRAGHGLVFWADARHRRTDRTWSNPLGGFPWSDDDPYWANNDLFSLSHEEVLESIKQGSLHRPRRWTPPSSFVRVARAQASTAGWYLSWAGRTAVAGKIAEAADPPRIFVAFLPAEENSRQQ